METSTIIQTLLNFIISSAASQIIGGAAYDVIKEWFRTQRKETIEDIYERTLVKILTDLYPTFSPYSENGARITIDRNRIHFILNSEINIHNSSDQEKLLLSITELFEKYQVVIIPGHQLTKSDYYSLMLQSIRTWWRVITQSIISDDILFRHYIQQNIEGNRLQTNQILDAIQNVQEHLRSISSILRIGERATIIDYLQDYIDQLQVNNLDDIYIELKCHDPEGNNLGYLHMETINWLSAPKMPFLCLFGDFGTGKTTFATNLFIRLSRQYLLSREAEGRIPILIYLKEYSNYSSIEQLINDYCLRFQLEPRQVFELNRHGKCLFIFDGLDELGASNSQNKAASFVMELRKILTEKSKVIITSRTHFFRSLSEQIDILNNSMGPRNLNLPGESSKLNMLYLSPFDKKDIIDYLKKRFDKKWRAPFNFIMNTYDLKELSERPILLRVICSTADQLKKFVKVNQAQLYELYIQRWISRESWRFLLNIDILGFIEDLALAFYEVNRYSISITELEERLNLHYPKLTTSELIQIESFMRTCTFLRREENGYGFMHQSFLEFFVARRLARELRKLDVSPMIRNRLLSREVILFLSNLTLDVADEVLWNLISNTKTYTVDKVGFQATNSVEILKSRNIVFENCDFNNTILPNVNFENINISGSSFINAYMPNSNLMTHLTQCNFSSAFLQGSSLGGNTAGVFDLSVSPQERTVACAVVNGEIYIANIEREPARLDIKKKIKGHEVQLRSIEFDPSGKVFASSSKDHIIKLWDAKTFKQLSALEGHKGSVGQICFAKTNLLVSASSDGSCRVWDLETGSSLIEKKHENAVKALAVNKDGEIAASGGFGAYIQIWNIRNGALISNVGPLVSPIRGITWSTSNANLIAVACSDGSVLVIDVIKNEILHSIKAHLSVVREVSFSSDGMFIASASWDGYVKIWNLLDGKEVVQISGHNGGAFCVSFLQRDELLITGSGDGTVSLFDVPSGGHLLSSFKIEGQYMDCSKLNITDVKGLDEDYIFLLKAYGAFQKDLV